MRRIAIAFGLIVTLSAFPINEALARTHAAIAVVWGQGRDFHGVGTGSTSGAARKAALASCQNGRCKIATDYGPGQCIFVVLGDRQVWWNERLFSARERKYTIAQCRKEDSNCHVIYSKCLLEQ